MNQTKQILFMTLFASLLCLNAHAAKKEKKAAPAASPAPVEVVATPTPVAVAATPTPAPVAEVPAAPVDTSEMYGKKNRPLGDVLVGPYLTAVALPRPVSFGVEGKWKDLVGLSAGYGFFPELTVSSVKLKITGWDARLKVYPFKGAFFFGVAYGSQTFTGSAVKTISSIPVTGTIVQDNTFITPHVGWNWVWDSGFFMGMDLGVQLSMSRTNAFSTDQPSLSAFSEYAQLEKDVTDKAELVGKTPLPLLTLIKVGYFF